LSLLLFLLLLLLDLRPLLFLDPCLLILELLLLLPRLVDFGQHHLQALVEQSQQLRIILQI